ncbi:hypothetical protein NJO91_02950 [Streptomyces microflavus]|uniref:hypothetical protein n=1 Tax=Streptomyces microflavus TaxID=1919 RepID=UPI0029B3FEED|nr:hypothetical protein [Streptomyces microflavus]MDX2402082.1 hypothetical protein [Streptomyces microflavus]
MVAPYPFTVRRVGCLRDGVGGAWRPRARHSSGRAARQVADRIDIVPRPADALLAGGSSITAPVPLSGPLPTADRSVVTKAGKTA